MNDELKAKLRNKTRLLRGLVRVLEYDADNIYEEAGNFDLYNIEESIVDAKNMIREMSNTIEEIDSIVRVLKRSSSRKFHNLL